RRHCPRSDRGHPTAPEPDPLRGAGGACHAGPRQRPGRCTGGCCLSAGGPEPKANPSDLDEAEVRRPQVTTEQGERSPQRAADLRHLIEYHNRLYHTLDEPEISDEDFDALFSELLQLEEERPELREPDSPTQKVGAPTSGRFAQVTHEEPML